MNDYLQSRPNLRALLSFGVSPEDTTLCGFVNELGEVLQMQCELLANSELDKDLYENVEKTIISVANIRKTLQKIEKEHREIRKEVCNEN